MQRLRPQAGPTQAVQNKMVSQLTEECLRILQEKLEEAAVERDDV